MRYVVRMLLIGLSVLGIAASVQAGFIDDFSGGIGAWNTSAATGSVAWDSTNQRVAITELGNDYANLYRSGGANAVVSLQADINDVSDTGTGWGPSLALYYDKNDYAQIRLRGTNLETVVYVNGIIDTTQFGSMTKGNWYTLKIGLDRNANTLNFYTGPQSGSLTLQESYDLPTTFGGNGYMILGKGVGTYGSDAFLRNSYGGGNNGVSQYDNAVFSTVPEPSSLVLLCLGALSLLAYAWQRRR